VRRIPSSAGTLAAWDSACRRSHFLATGNALQAYPSRHGWSSSTSANGNNWLCTVSHIASHMALTSARIVTYLDSAVPGSARGAVSLAVVLVDTYIGRAAADAHRGEELCEGDAHVVQVPGGAGRVLVGVLSGLPSSARPLSMNGRAWPGSCRGSRHRPGRDLRSVVPRRSARPRPRGSRRLASLGGAVFRLPEGGARVVTWGTGGPGGRRRVRVQARTTSSARRSS
jgi:hypothetical protein